jgi:hypothetical protein
MDTAESARNHVYELLRLINIASSVTENNPRGHIETLARGYVQTLSLAQHEVSLLFNQKRDAIVERERRNQLMNSIFVEYDADAVEPVVAAEHVIDLTENNVDEGSVADSVADSDAPCDRDDDEREIERERQRVEANQRQMEIMERNRLLFRENADRRNREILETREQERLDRQEQRRLQEIHEEEERQVRQELDTLERQENYSRTLIRTVTRTVKALKKYDVDTCLGSECSICLETPMLVNSSITNCDHNFCGGCLDNWVVEHKKITCPACRTRLTRIVSFKPRKTPVRSGAVAVMESLV